MSEGEIDGAIPPPVVLGEPWWQDFDRSMNFDVDTLASRRQPTRIWSCAIPGQGGHWYAGTVDRVGADGSPARGKPSN